MILSRNLYYDWVMTTTLMIMNSLRWFTFGCQISEPGSVHSATDRFACRYDCDNPAELLFYRWSFLDDNVFTIRYNTMHYTVYKKTSTNIHLKHTALHFKHNLIIIKVLHFYINHNNCSKTLQKSVISKVNLQWGIRIEMWCNWCLLRSLPTV